MDKLLTPIALVESALWISFQELLCCKWLTYCTFSLLWLCNVLALSSWVCVLSRGQNSWNSKFSTPFYLILKTSAVLCLQMYLIKISQLISWGNKFILSFKKSSVLFQVIPPYLHFTHLPTHSSSPSTILTPLLHSHPTPSPPSPLPPPHSLLPPILHYSVSLLTLFLFWLNGFFLLFWQFLPRLYVSSWRLCVDLFFKLWRTDYRWISKEQLRWKPRKRRWRKR